MLAPGSLETWGFILTMLRYVLQKAWSLWAKLCSNLSSSNKQTKRHFFPVALWYATVKSCPPCFFWRGLHPQSWGEHIVVPPFTSLQSTVLIQAHYQCEQNSWAVPPGSYRLWIEKSWWLRPRSRTVLWIKVLKTVMARWARAPLSKP